MNTLLLSLFIGVIAGILDIIPMIIKKLPKSNCISAFLQYLFVSVIIINIDLPNIVWWLEGGLIAFMMAIPIVVLVAQGDKKAVPIILTNAIVLGTLIGFVGHNLK